MRCDDFSTRSISDILAGPPVHERIELYLESMPWVGPDEPPERQSAAEWLKERTEPTPSTGLAELTVDGERHPLAITDVSLTVDGTEPDHETIEQLPKGCLFCDEEDLEVNVTWNGDGEIDRSRLRCTECGWTVTGQGPKIGRGW